MAAVTRDLLKALRIEINNELAAIGRKHGIIITAANGSFSPDGITGHFKLELANAASAPQGACAHHVVARADYLRYGPTLFGLQKEWLDKTFVREGHAYTIIGLLPNRTKFPVLCMKDGKEMVLPALAVVERMKAVTA